MAFNGKRMRDFRRGKKISQKTLAKALGTTQQVISEYERGENIKQWNTLARICSYLGMSADYVLELSSTAPMGLSSNEAAVVDDDRAGNENALNDAMDKAMLDGLPGE